MNTELPATSNVFGTLSCGVSLEHVRHCLVSRAGLPAGSLRLSTSQYDGAQTLEIATESLELEVRAGAGADTWFFNGAVAGNLEQIRQRLSAICQPLAFANFPSAFEIYDDKFSLLGTIAFDARV